MELTNEYPLSVYLTIGFLPGSSPVAVVQNSETGKIFLRKELYVYKRSVFRYLQNNPVPGIPRIIGLYEEPVPLPKRTAEERNAKKQKQLTVIEEYITGKTLQEMLEEGHEFSEGEAADIVCKLCDILDQLHGCNPPILHRNIKLSNVLMDMSGNIWLLDLNAAKWLEDETEPDIIVRKAAHGAAVGQSGTDASGIQADIYALGEILNVLVTGEVPQKTEAEGRLAKVIRKCCQMEGHKHFRSVKELKTALDPIAAGKEPASLLKWLKAYALPGFRSSNGLIWILALAGYGFLIERSFHFSLVENTLAPLPYRIVVLLTLLSLVLFIGNYRGIQSKLPLSDSDKPLLRILGVVLWSILIFVIGVMLGDMILKLT